MRIVYDHQIFSAYQYGGVARYFYELANHIANMNKHSVEIFSPLYINEYFSSSSSVRPSGVKVPVVTGLERYAAWGIDSVLSYGMIKPRRDIDIFHETYYSAISSSPGSAKKIVTVYDMIHELFPDQSAKRNRTSQAKMHAVTNADHVICISKNTRNDLITIFGVPEEKTSVVYLGCSFTSDSKKKPPNVDKPYLLFVGQRAGYKNFERMLLAYARSLKLSTQLSLICFGGGSFTEYENSLMSELGLSPKNIIQISGDDDVLVGLYDSAEAFVYPSLYEGFGIPLLEAMSLNCPVICSNTSCFQEVVENAAELFDPNDEYSLLQAIEKVVFSKEVKELLISRGRKRIKNFSWNKCAKETVQIYSKLCLC